MRQPPPGGIIQGVDPFEMLELARRKLNLAEELAVEEPWITSPAIPDTASRGGSGAVEDDILGSFPEGHLSEWPKVLLPLGHTQEVVAGKLPRLAREARARVGEQDLGL